MRRNSLIFIAILLGASAACGDDAASGDDARDALGDDDVAADAADADAAVDVAPPLPVTCLAPTSMGGLPAGTRLEGPLGVAEVAVDGGDDGRAACHRTYTLTSTAVRRDDLPTSPRVVAEIEGAPTLRSGHDLFDALYALALVEARENAVDAIRDGAFANNQSVPCGDGGCFETGRKWTYVWTRDTAYATDLGLAPIDPTRVVNSLSFKLSERREGGDLQIVQDTGSGGSYPVSSDRVSWALGARAALLELEGDAREAFRDLTLEALTHTIEHDRDVVFEAETGLYRGEQSFLDWREQSYPGWTQLDVIDVATSRALGTNVAHLVAIELAAALADEVGDAARRDRYAGWGEALRAAIAERLWLDDVGLFAATLPNTLDPAPGRRYDLLGLAGAVIEGVATPEQARRVLASYPHYGPGAPVLWPQSQRVPIYHNRGEWPFVTAYWLAAARVARNDAVTERMVSALMRGAALNLSNMENFEAWTGAPWLEDGTASGPVVNSQRQLWSVAGYLGMVQRVIFGLAPRRDGLAVAPWITAGLHRELFGDADRIVLNDYPFRGRRVTVVVHLPSPPEAGEGGGYRVAELAVDGAALDGAPDALEDGVVPLARLTPHSRVDVTLARDPEAVAATLTERDAADWRQIFAPRTPQILGLSDDDGRVRLELGLGGEEATGLALHVYRDGERVAANLPPAALAWTDPDSDAAGPRTPCYAVEASFMVSGNRSHRSRVSCWWGEAGERVSIVPATAFEAEGGALVDEHGAPHYQGWGDPGHTLTARGYEPVQSGPHLVQVRYGNGAGPINTGIACGVKRVTVYDEDDDAVVATGILVMPQLGDGSWSRWALSSFVAAELDAARTYRVVISADARTANMSARTHFATYRGTGGAGGPFERVNIAELRVLAR